MRNLLQSGAAALVCLPLVLASAVCAQNAPNVAKLSPAQLLAEASAENGLANVSVPWHARVNFAIFDRQTGALANSGTFEEWSFGPKSYKAVYKSEKLNQTDVATEHGLFRAGDQQWPADEQIVAQLVTKPMDVNAPRLSQVELLNQTAGSGQAQMRCVSSYPKLRPDQHIGSNMPRDLSALPSVCFAKDSVVLRSRSTGPGGPYSVFDKIVRFEGKYVAGDTALIRAGKPWITLQVVQLAAIPGGTPPPEPPEGSTGPLHGPIEVPGILLHPVDHVHEALQTVEHAIPPNVDTEVKLKLDIGPDGHVRSAEVLSGPPVFAAVVAKAARQVTFAPFTILDTPVEATSVWTQTFSNRSTSFELQ